MYHLVSINCRYSHSCLALFYLRNELEVYCSDIPLRISQLTINDPYYDTLLRLTSTPAKALFFSVYIWNHNYIQRLIRDICSVLPGLPIILGGPQASSMGDLPDQCTVVSGEIEAIDRRFYKDLAEGQLRSHYDAGSSKRFPSPYKSEDFDELLKHRQLYYESSRGCPFRCSYCLSSLTKSVRHKPLEQVKSELLEMIRARPIIIKFVDRTFNDDLERALEIWQFLAQNGQGVRFHFEIAPDRFNHKMLEFLAALPCNLFQFEMGIQSCTEAVLRAVNRKMNLDQAVNNIKALVRMNNINLHLDLILGLPFETVDSFHRSFNTVFRLEPHYIQLGLLKVLPGTKLARSVNEYGLSVCHQPPYEALATRWLDHKQLAGLYELCECAESFYNTRFFKSVWRYLVQKQEDMFLFFSDLLNICRGNDFFQLAPTQKLMTFMLFELSEKRSDKELLHDLLRYDWFRCGQKNLPGFLELVSQAEIRKKLNLILPQNLEGVFDYQSRAEFFKKSSFLIPSAKVAKILGMPDRHSVMVFLAEQETGVVAYNKLITI